jgi:imidazolonepropionase-like amidohydrolase
VSRSFSITFALLCAWLSAARLRAESPQPLVIRGVRVFDGVSVYPSATISIRDGKIAELKIGDGPVPKEAEVIDGRGKTLIPGLIDCHTHAFLPGMLRQAAVFGVTTELDMFTVNLFARAMRAGQASGRALDRADLFSAGTLVTVKGGHGSQYRVPIPTISKPEEAQAFVDARIAEGSDYIKIAYDNGSELGLKWPTLSREALGAVIRAAHARNKYAVVHALAREEARTALEEGADGLVHIFIDKPIDDAFIALAARREAFIIPTLTVLESARGIGGASLADDPSLKPYLSSSNIKALRSTFPSEKVKVDEVSAKRAAEISSGAVRKLHKAGVAILAGTDAINPGTAHGASLHRELELLVDAGLTPLEAISAATALVGNKLRFLGNRGQLTVGAPADMVLVEGDPFTNIKATRAIVGVWKHGKRIDREAYRKNFPDDQSTEPKDDPKVAK